MMHMDKETIVENINSLCRLKGIYPTNACKESGVGPSFISDVKRGRVPSVDKVQALAEYLGCTTSELLGEVGPKKKPSPTKETLEMRDRIFFLLKERGISQEDFAHSLGISPQTVRDWETGKSSSFSAMPFEVADALQTPPAWLRFGYGSKYLAGDPRSAAEDRPEDAEVSKSDTNPFELTETEVDLIKGFRTLNEDGQEKVLDYTSDLIQTGIYKNVSQSGAVSKDA
jgi:transcriptional regulator with XRE-family HTH domain